MILMWFVQRNALLLLKCIYIWCNVSVLWFRFRMWQNSKRRHGRKQPQSICALCKSQYNHMFLQSSMDTFTNILQTSYSSKKIVLDLWLPLIQLQTEKSTGSLTDRCLLKLSTFFCSSGWHRSLLLIQFSVKLFTSLYHQDFSWLKK